MFFCLVTPSYAAKNNNTGSIAVENQNKVQTQNEGEDSELQVSTAEKEGTEGGSFNRSQTAVEHMSTVAAEVQKLLQVRTSGGIGDQVRVIAQEQNQVQQKIQEELDKVNSRGQLKKILFGADLNALKSLTQLMEQNQLRIEQLTLLKEQLSNQADEESVQATIQALTDENTSLQEIINEQQEVKSLFGWLIKLFAK